MRDEAREALARGEAHLRGLQSPEGYWWGELESNATITAEHVFLLARPRPGRRRPRRRLANELLATQGDGRRLAGLVLGPAGPVDHGRGVLRPAPLRRPRVRPAAWRGPARWCWRPGGANRARFFTKLWLAVLGRYPWSALPVLPPEMILLPPRAPMSPYRFASWARGTFVALMIVLSRNPTFPQPVGLEELFLEPAGRGPRPAARRPPGRGRRCSPAA